MIYPAKMTADNRFDQYATPLVWLGLFAENRTLALFFSTLFYYDIPSHLSHTVSDQLSLAVSSRTCRHAGNKGIDLALRTGVCLLFRRGRPYAWRNELFIKINK